MDISALSRELSQINFKTDWVVVENGALKKVQGAWDSFLYIINSTSHNNAVRKYLNAQVKQIACLDSSFLAKHATTVNKIFFEQLVPTEYDRSLIKRWSSLEAILAPELGSVRFGGSKDSVTSRNISETKVETEFAIRLGVQPSLVQNGVSGTYLMRARTGKPLGVFKPTDESADGINCPKILGRLKTMAERYACIPHDVKKIFTRRSGVHMEHAHLSEAASSALDKMLGFRIVPHTEVAEFTSDFFSGRMKTKRGSFQLFGQGKEACEALGIEHLKKGKRQVLLQEFSKSDMAQVRFNNFEEFAFFDMLVGNIDRHFENWLLNKKTDGSFDIIAIDQGAAFPSMHPHRGRRIERALGWLNEYLSIRYMYLWDTMPHANTQFSEPMKRKILSINPKALEALLRKELVDRNEKATGTVLDEKIARMQERLEIIQRLVGEGATIREIAGIRTDKDYKTML